MSSRLLLIGPDLGKHGIGGVTIHIQRLRDCLEKNDELIELSPLFRTVKTPAEVFSCMVPDFLKCFDSYYKALKLFIKLSTPFYKKNKREIKELLDLKFKNMHIEKEYKINGLVNFILINFISDKFGREYPDKNIKNILKEKWTSQFFDKSLIKYAKFNHFCPFKFYFCARITIYRRRTRL